MATTEHERLELYELAKHEVGERFAELMMKSLPQDPDELVRKTDLAATEQRLGARIDGVEQRIDGLEQRLDTRIDGLEQRLDARTDGLEQRLDARTDGLEQRFDARATVLASELRVEMRDLTSAQTRTMMLGLVGSVTALSITELVINALG